MRPEPTTDEVSIKELGLSDIALLWWSQTWRLGVLLLVFLPLFSLALSPMFSARSPIDGPASALTGVFTIVLLFATGFAYWYLWLRWVLRASRGPVRVALLTEQGRYLNGLWCGTGMLPQPEWKTMDVELQRDADLFEVNALRVVLLSDPHVIHVSHADPMLFQVAAEGRVVSRPPRLVIVLDHDTTQSDWDAVLSLLRQPQFSSLLAGPVDLEFDPIGA